MKKMFIAAVMVSVLIISILFSDEIYTFMYKLIKSNEVTEVITERLEYERTLNAVVKTKYDDGTVKVQILDTEITANISVELYFEIEDGDNVRVRKYKVIDKKTNLQTGTKYEIVR